MSRGFIRVALLFHALAGAVLITWGGRMHDQLLLPTTVATVHLYVLGVLTMSLIGLALERLPALTGQPLPWPGLNRWTLFLLSLGALTVFLGIGTDLHRWNLLAASLGMGLGIGFFIVQAGWMLFSSTRHDGLILILKLSILSLTGVLGLGAIFLGEYAHGFLEFDRLAMVGAHLTLGIYGWAGLMLMALRRSTISSVTRRPETLPMSVVIGAFLSLCFIPWMLFKPDSGLYWLWPSILPGFATIAMISAHPHENRFWRAGDLMGVAAFLVLSTWPLIPDERTRFLFGVLILPGWTLGQLLGIYDHRNPGRLGVVHLGLYLASVALPALGLFLPWQESWQVGGIAWLLLSVLFVNAHQKGEARDPT
ncbi:MAG: hypothetical protein HQL97_11480 [Magnetococcales bacterium]|nr:hypothetical protein [Magnetococcales bacterium]